MACATCQLFAPQVGRDRPPTGFCLWFLKKLDMPKPIPQTTFDAGCKNHKPTGGH